MASTLKAKRGQPRFKNIGQKDGLVQQVVQAIEDQILRGRLDVGARLPPEREFSDQLGVSRPVVREAVRILTTQGLLETKHGIGTTVRAMTRDEALKPLKLFLQIRGEDVSIEHLHQVRSVLEVENAGLAAEQGADEDIHDLSTLCQEMAAASDDPARFAVTDSAFHRRLSETSHNPLLILLLDSVHEMMGAVRSLVAYETALHQRVMPTHFRILEAVMAHDGPSAREAMREHLKVALAIQVELIRKQKNSEAHD